MIGKDTIGVFFAGDGSSQDQRAPVALPATYAKMDDRRMEEILAVIYKYAAYVFYYVDKDAVNPEGDWQSFFRNNIPFQYAVIQQFRQSDLESAYNEARGLFTDRITRGSFWPLFNRIMAVALRLNTWQNQLDTNSSLHRVGQSLIRSDFSKAIARLIAVSGSFTIRQNDFANDLDDLRSNEDWGLTLEKLLAVDKRLAKFDPHSRRKENETLAELDDIFQIFYKGVAEVQQYARDNFEEALSGSGYEEPHLGLLYSFLRLLIKIRDSKKGLNDITGRHLDFFYKDILGLKHRPHQPDHVHVVIELAKQVSTYLLEKNTKLKDGKDIKGKDISFLLEEETVFNKATIEQLRTLYKDAKATLYSAPVANSADGLGAGFQNPANNSWPVLGTEEFTDKNIPDDEVKKSYPFARTGFVISSSVLLMREGARDIHVSMSLEKLAGMKSSLADIVSEPLYLINESSLAAFEKAGVSKGGIKIISDKINNLPGQEAWLKASQFVSFTFITDSILADKAKSVSFVSLLEVFYSSVEGWIPAPSPALTFDTATNILTIDLKLKAGDKPVSPLDPQLQKDSFPMKDPGLKIVFNQRLRHSFLVNDDTPWYDVLSKATIGKIFVNVKASGIKNVLLSNDDGVIDPNKKFFPFTGIPKIGSSFFIGSDEMFRKRLTGLNMAVEWDGLTDLEVVYAAYPSPPKNKEFTATLQKYRNAVWEPWTPTKKLELFTDGIGGDTVRPANDLAIDPLNFLENEASATDIIDLPVLNLPVPLAPYGGNSVDGFIRLVLDRDFYHLDYPFILANSTLSIGKFDFSVARGYIETAGTGIVDRTSTVKTDADTADSSAIDLVNGAAGSSANLVQSKTALTKTDAAGLSAAVSLLHSIVGATGVLPKPPHTPAIKSFHFDYTAAAGAAEITMLHLYPFEDANYRQLPTPIDSPALLPAFDNEGYLYIGLTNANPGSNIALLFQLSEYSANPDIEATVIEWSYLKDNDWIVLKKDIDVISDTTQGLLVSGIVTVSLPWDANTQHTILPSKYHWLRVSAPSSTKAVCEAIIVAAQGARAVFQNNDNDLERLSEPLAAGSIAGLLDPRSEIKKISQDFPSFKGRKEETDDQFYIRVSERLRHKGRSITIFDYERLVLETFPAVFKVKCIPHTKICKVKGKITPLSSPGWVSLAVIPDVTGYTAQTRLRPEVSRIVLKEIEDYFLTRSSGFVKVQAINPDFQYVDFEGNIKFLPGKDELFYIRQLAIDVRNYLSPWIKGGSKNIVFGGTLMMSSVLKFIEDRDYVSYVTDFVMKDNNKPVKAVTALRPWTILVSDKQVYTAIQDDCASVKQVRGLVKIKKKLRVS